MNVDVTDDELGELASWMGENVVVHLAPGVDSSDVDYGVLNPGRVRDLSADNLESLNTRDKIQLNSLLNAWRNWCDRDDAPDSPVYESTLGTSPWRKQRRKNPPTVPLGRDDLVWMEWNESVNGQYHRAVPDGEITVVGGAGQAVLTTRARANDLGAYACPDCFPDDAGPYVSVTDAETGIRTTVKTDEIDTVPDDVLDELDTTAQSIQDARDESPK